MPIIVNSIEALSVNVNGSPVSTVRANTVQVFSSGPREQTFLSNGTFTVPAGITEIAYCMCGGGGHAGFGTSTQQNWAGGGGSGAITGTLTVVGGETYPVVIGAGGDTGTSSAQASTITLPNASVITAGAGGDVANNSNVPGVGVNGGGNGGGSFAGGYYDGAPSTSACGGQWPGGTSTHENHGGGGGGGGYGAGAGSENNAAANTGGGGSGGHINGDFNGSNGGSGKCVITW